MPPYMIKIDCSDTEKEVKNMDELITGITNYIFRLEEISMKRWRKIIATAILAVTMGSVSFTSFAKWEKDGDSYVYYEKDGTKAVNTFKVSGSQWFYLDENGYILKNCEREIDGKIYMFDEKGVCDRTDTRLPGTSADEITAKNQWRKDKYSDGGEFVAISGRQQYLNKIANSFMENQTVQWINATYAILTRSNTENIRAFGGSLKLDGIETGGADLDNSNREFKRKSLESSWGVTDRATADYQLEALLSSGENTGSAWDYSRAMSNLGFYYVAGYYTQEEALDKALETAKIIQTKFTSWDEFASSYLVGYEAWSGESQEERRTIYENLKASKFNPYALDWNLKLEKSW